MYVCMYVCVWMYVYLCVCMYVCMCVCIYVCMYVCMYVCQRGSYSVRQNVQNTDEMKWITSVIMTGNLTNNKYTDYLLKWVEWPIHCVLP